MPSCCRVLRQIARIGCRVATEHLSWRSSNLIAAVGDHLEPMSPEEEAAQFRGTDGCDMKQRRTLRPGGPIMPIDWSRCPAVRIRPGYLSGRPALRDDPRVPP